MVKRLSALIALFLLSVAAGVSTNAQVKVWTVDDCIRYALDKNIQVQKAEVSNSIIEENLKLAKSAWYPSVSGSARQNYGWSNVQNSATGSTVFTRNDMFSVTASSGITVYNGSRIRNSVKQSETDYEADKYNTEVIRETVSLNVLNAYLQVLYAGEQVKNSNDQITSLAEQLVLADERMKLGVISNSDYLQVKSQLATEKQSLAVAQSQLSSDRISLMQLMEYPISSEFQIERPNLDSLVNQKRNPDAEGIYQTALQVKPEVKNAELARKSSQIGIDLAKSRYYPNISMDAGVSTSYSGQQKEVYSGSQLSNNISPTVGLSASIPIYSNREAKTGVAVAKLNTNNAELNEYNTRDILRKEIEQACQDVESSQIEYEASLEAYKAVKESYDVASEKYFQGLMNSVDFLIQKTSFISSESSLLQSKYRLIFSYKVLDFYSGQPLTFRKQE